MGSQEQEEPHYNLDSDGEPPTDEVGDKITVIQKRQVIKEILEVGQNLGKPGRPFIVTITLEGYLAKPKDKEPHSGARIEEIKEEEEEKKEEKVE